MLAIEGALDDILTPTVLLGPFEQGSFKLGERDRKLMGVPQNRKAFWARRKSTLFTPEQTKDKEQKHSDSGSR